MPIYEYECRDCGKKFEKIHMNVDPDFDYTVWPCEGCGKDSYRTVSATSSLTGKTGRGSLSGLEAGSDTVIEIEEGFLGLPAKMINSETGSVVDEGILGIPVSRVKESKKN